jgi:KDO2-lipid IV(A) lauroyltransferase
MYYLLRYQRSVVTDNLSRAFPDKSADTIAVLAKNSYRNAIHVLFETIKGLSIDEQELRKRVDIENPELLETLLQRYNTVLTCTTHQGNWEWLLLAYASRAGFRLAVLYKRITHSGFNALMLQMRRRFGSTPIEARSGLGELIRFSRQAGVIALAADQGPRAEENKHWSRFLGLDTAFYPGPEKLALLLNAPLVFVHMKRLKRGYYRIRLELLAEPPYEEIEGQLMERYIRSVEKQVLEAPQDWLWIYKRWKYSREP